jgi:hypothetical protein
MGGILRQRVTVRITTCYGALALCLLQACASTPPPATDAQKQQAIHDFFKCAIQQERAVDDGVSDAKKAALALTERCIKQYDAAKHFLFTGKRAQRLNTSEMKTRASLNVVLQMRLGAQPNPNY